MSRLERYILICVAISAGLGPFVYILLGGEVNETGLSVLSLCGWTFAIVLAVTQFRLVDRMVAHADLLGVTLKIDAPRIMLDRFFRECARRLGTLRLNYVDNPIESRMDLSASLRSIVNEAHQLLSAVSTELALFDKETGTVHSSFVVGLPFREDAPQQWRDLQETGRVDPQVAIQPLVFSGTLLGTIRVAVPAKRKVSQADKELLQVLAVQGAVALLNAEYSTELVKMRRTSEESIKAKTGFLANLSHELRGPLGLMLNAVELVLDELCGPVNTEQKETLGMVKKNGSHLLDLINDVLDYAKSESGRMKVEPVDQTVNEFLTEMSNVVRAQAEAKKHKITLTLLKDNAAFTCDKRHSRQMIINLLTNAIKYTPPEGKIEIGAERVSGARIKLWVKDSGVGIASADRDKVFTAFERVDHEYSKKQNGTGLGMPLTRKLAEVNGGSVDFQSEIGSGSLFWIVLPAAVSDAGEVESTLTIEDTQIKSNGERVLVIEPNESERSLVERYLKNLGFVVRAVAHQGEAQDVLAREKVDLAIIDNETIDTPNSPVLKLIQNSIATKRIPLVLVSSRAFVFDIEEYLKRGVDRCLPKPFTMKELGMICRELIDNNREVTKKSDVYVRPVQ